MLPPTMIENLRRAGRIKESWAHICFAGLAISWLLGRLVSAPGLDAVLVFYAAAALVCWPLAMIDRHAVRVRNQQFLTRCEVFANRGFTFIELGVMDYLGRSVVVCESRDGERAVGLFEFSGRTERDRLVSELFNWCLKQSIQFSIR